MASSSSWFPSGKRFDPKDDELLVHLFNFIAGDPFSSQDSILIPIVDLYGDEEPWDIFAKYSSPSQKKTKKKGMFFYTRLKKKIQNGNCGKRKRTNQNQNGGKRFSRLIGGDGGSWHGQDKGKPIFYEGGKGLFGYKKSMNYKNDKNQIQDGQWLLKEYSLADNVLVDMVKENICVPERKDFVLCLMRQKKIPKKSEPSKSVGDGSGDLSELFKRFQDIRKGKDLSFEPCVEEVINVEPPQEICPLFQESDIVNEHFSPPSPSIMPLTPDSDPLFLPLDVLFPDMFSSGPQESDTVNEQFSPLSTLIMAGDEELQEDIVVAPLTPDSDPFLDVQLQDMLENADSFLDCLNFEFNADGEDLFWKSYTEQQVLAK